MLRQIGCYLHNLYFFPLVLFLFNLKTKRFLSFCLGKLIDYLLDIKVYTRKKIIDKSRDILSLKWEILVLHSISTKLFSSPSFFFLPTLDLFVTNNDYAYIVLIKEKTWNLSFFHCEIWLPSTRNLAPREVLYIRLPFRGQEFFSVSPDCTNSTADMRGQLRPFPAFFIPLWLLTKRFLLPGSKKNLAWNSAVSEKSI